MNPTASKGYYSLIQYCPDLGRLEAANIGVLLFSPEKGFIRAKTARNNTRIIKFFGSHGHDWERINTFKQGIEERINVEGACFKTLEDLQRFIEQRANLIQITSPRPMRVEDPEAELLALYKEFIGEVTHRTQKRTLKRILSDRFQSSGIESFVRKDIKVKVPVLEREVEIPFGFQNGKFNLITPVPFESSNPEQSIRTAYKYAFQGRALFEHRVPRLGEVKLVVVGKFRSRDRESQTTVGRILRESHVDLYKTTEIGELVQVIKTTGKRPDTVGN